MSQTLGLLCCTFPLSPAHQTNNQANNLLGGQGIMIPKPSKIHRQFIADQNQPTLDTI